MAIHPETPLGDTPAHSPLPDTAPFVILGAAGSGKTTALMGHIRRLVADSGYHPDQLKLLTPTRIQATTLRDELGCQVGKSTRGAMVMSVAAFAFDIVRFNAQHRGLEPPRLRSGADVDQDILDLLVEQESSGTSPAWPEHLSAPVRRTETFRTELRELIARLTEHGVSLDQLRQWSHVHPAWPAVADFLADYQRVIARSRPHEYDSAELLRLATALVADGVVREQGIRAVFVDNFHDVSPATTDFMLALHHAGVAVGVSADPDLAGQTFRGADPEGPARLAEALGVTPIVFDQVFRHGPTIRHLVGEVTSRVGTALAGSQRRAVSVTEDRAPALAVVSPSPSRQAHDIARLLRDAHRQRGVPYSEMAVVVRRAGAIPPLASALRSESIPTETDFRLPLAQHPATRELIGWIGLARRPQQVEHAELNQLLTGVYGGLSRRQLRRLGFLLRALDSQDGENLSAAESIAQLVTDAVVPIGLPESWHQPLERVLRVVRSLRELPESTTADVLASTAWQLWGVEDQWVSRATDQQRPSQFAKDSLTQVAALLRTAERYVASHPGVDAMVFFDSVLRAEVTEDVVMPRTERRGVTIATPASVAGEEFRVVALAGVNDHVWPNTRIRGSLLGAPLVARALRGQLGEAVDEARVVIDDELRMAALSLSRASDQVIVTAIRSEEDQPSALFELLASRCQMVESEAEHTGSSRTLVGAYRQAATLGEDSAAAALGYLHSMGVPGAHPESWWGLAEPSSNRALFEGQRVHVSPSKLGAVEESALDWFLDRVAPDDLPPSVGVGSLVHYAMEMAPTGSAEELAELVTARFSELDFESGWQAAAHHRRALDYVAALADYLADRGIAGASVAATEAQFSVELDGAVLVGVIDRVERETDGRFVVVDLKTGQPLSDNKVVDDPQLSAYQLALQDGELATQLDSTGKLAGAWLLFVREGVGGKSYRLANQQPLDDEALSVFRQRVLDAAGRMSSREFEGPRVNTYGASTVSVHRWQRVQAVCGD